MFTTIVNLETLSISDGDVFKLSILMCLLWKIAEIRFSNPMLFSVYTDIVYNCFSVLIFLKDNKRKRFANRHVLSLIY